MQNLRQWINIIESGDVSNRPSLGFWKVEIVRHGDAPPTYQITRNGNPVGDTWIFKGQAVHHKERLQRAEQMAIKDTVMKTYDKEQ